MRFFFIIASLNYFLLGASLGYAEPTGVWVTEGGRSLINIADCEPKANQPRILCSKIIWLKEPFNKDGEPLRDKRNQDRNMRSRPILGMPVLMNLRQVQNDTWDGNVYNPEDGKIYRAQVISESASKLVVKGCAKVLFSWVCKSRTWERAPQELLRSDMPLEPQINESQPQAQIRNQ